MLPDLTQIEAFSADWCPPTFDTRNKLLSMHMQALRIWDTNTRQRELSLPGEGRRAALYT